MASLTLEPRAQKIPQHWCGRIVLSQLPPGRRHFANHPASGPKQGFTLIELLVVIAIISLLAAILFPVFSRVRENARRSSCTSNMKQIGLGMMQYAQDYDEGMPLLRRDLSNSPLDTAPFWSGVTQPYTKSSQIFNCPSDTSNYVPFAVDSATLPGSYIYNATYFTEANRTPPCSLNTPSGPVIFRLAQLVAASTTVWVGEGGTPGVTSKHSENYYIDTNKTVTFGGTPPQTNSIDDRNFVARHLDTMNTLYCDGHVKAVKLDAIFGTKNAGGAYAALTAQDD